MDLDLGDEIKFYEEPVTVRVVGILSPIDPVADVWWGDHRLLPFNIHRETGLSQTDTIFISLLVSPEIMKAELPSHEMYWRFLLDLDAIDVQNADLMRDRLVKLESNLNSLGGHSDWRIPNCHELPSLVVKLENPPTFDVTAFPSAPTGYHWTSSSRPGAVEDAFHVYFNNGYVYYLTKNAISAYLRLVRG